MKKIVITGGHLTPALALIEELQKEKDTKIVFFGRKYATEGSKNTSAEYKIIKEKNIEFVNITTGRLQRKFTPYTISSLLKVPLGIIQSTYFLIKYRPEVVVSFGGYLSVPVVLAASLLGPHIISHEQTCAPGIATKLNSIFSKIVFLTWPSSQKYFQKEKTKVIGNPTRKEIFKSQPKDPGIKKFINSSKKLIVVTGGNQGSHFLNSLIFNLVKKMPDINFIHLVGTANFQNDHAKAAKIKAPNYLSRVYIEAGEMGPVIKSADFIIGRSGANTVWDVSILGKSAIFIPLPISAAGEQLKNAEVLEKAGSAKILIQKETDEEKLKDEIDSFYKNLKNYHQSAANFQKTLPKDAAEKMATYIKNL